MRFDWVLAFTRWVRGGVVGAVTGLGAMQLGEMAMRGMWIAVIVGVLSAMVVDLDAFAKSRRL